MGWAELPLSFRDLRGGGRPREALGVTGPAVERGAWGGARGGAARYLALAEGGAVVDLVAAGALAHGLPAAVGTGLLQGHKGQSGWWAAATGTRTGCMGPGPPQDRHVSHPQHRPDTDGCHR